MKVYFSVREGTDTSTIVPFNKPSGTTTAVARVRTPNTDTWAITTKIAVAVNTNDIVLSVVAADAIPANWPRDFRINLTNGGRTWTAISGTVYFQAVTAGDSNIEDGAVTTPKIAAGAVTAAKLNSDVVEYVQDVLGSSIVAGTNATVTYNDAAGTLTIAATGGGAGIDAETARDLIGSTLVAGTNINIVVNDASDTVTLSVTGLTKSSVGLGNVDNTSDANKPVSSATQTALNGKANTAHAHVVADVSDFLESLQDSVNAMIVAGSNVTKSYDDATGQLTINSTGGSGSTDAEIVRDTIAGALVAGTNINITVNDAADTITIAVTGLTKSSVGLGNVDNTSDANKPVSTAQQTALDGKANTVHTHVATDVTDFNAAVEDYLASQGGPAAHTHDAADINAGLLGIARLPAGSTIVVDKAKADYGAAGSWPATRPTARTDIVVEWMGAEPGPGALQIAGDKRLIVT